MSDVLELTLLNLAVTIWNSTHPPGTPVEYTPHPDATPRRTRTRSIAWLLGGHTAVVMIEGMAGGVALTHLRVLAEEPGTEAGTACTA
ncbi:MAG: hypothetical protein AMXMBFR77_27740 [Phycisphaerales bacterium]